MPGLRSADVVRARFKTAAPKIASMNESHIATWVQRWGATSEMMLSPETGRRQNPSISRRVRLTILHMIDRTPFPWTSLQSHEIALYRECESD
ncbi:hypothetical protein EVAR_64993_1 [Eumeta japonica]|uniref:Uncharacterized protein n=1 Tax=Eumeta variegata TaxID=151549 RepID=A0A4C1ZVQ5_EUMVA|nr:hypothetical protein EVAR_64993_1 [Eumeta japonica]